MTKNQRKKYQQVPRAEENDRKASSAKNEINAELKSETTEKAHDFINLQDFPQLSTSRGSRESGNQRSSSRAYKKSWLSIVTSGKTGNLGEAFPHLPGSEEREKENRINSEKDKSNLQPNVGKEGAENTGIKIEVQGAISHRESKPNPAKKIPAQPPRNPYKKKRSDPVFFNFEDLCTQKRKRSRKHDVPKRKIQRQRNKESLSGNYLDSSNPIRKRGKHREIKKKKLTKLKLAIVKERIIKQKMKEKAIAEYFTGNECLQVVEKIDFKTEIKAYLDELSKRKAQKAEITKGEVPGNVRLGKGVEESEDIKEAKGVEKVENSKNVVSEEKGKKVPQVVAGGEIKFTTKFREYCDNTLTSALSSAAGELIKELVKLQDRLFARDPVKAKARKRLVSGIREAKKYLTLKKAKLIIIAPNLEKLQMEGGVYDSINKLKSMALEQSVPCGFALDRYGLGRCTKKNVPVSAIAVLNYEGAEVLFESTLHHLEEAKKSFLELTGANAKKAEDTGEEDVNAGVVSSLLSVFREGLKLSGDNERLCDEEDVHNLSNALRKYLCPHTEEPH